MGLNDTHKCVASKSTENEGRHCLSIDLSSIDLPIYLPISIYYPSCSSCLQPPTNCAAASTVRLKHMEVAAQCYSLASTSYARPHVMEHIGLKTKYPVCMYINRDVFTYRQISIYVYTHEYTYEHVKIHIIYIYIHTYAYIICVLHMHMCLVYTYIQSNA